MVVPSMHNYMILTTLHSIYIYIACVYIVFFVEACQGDVPVFHNGIFFLLTLVTGVL